MQTRIAYKVLTPAYVGKAVDCIAASFTGDPFSVSNNLTPKHWAALAGMFVERAAHNDPGLSVVAVNVEKDRVEGVMVNEDWKQKQPPEYRELKGDEWRPVRAIFNQLHIKFKADHPAYIEPGQILHPLYFTSVRPEARRMGILKKLIDESIEIATDYHYQAIIAEAASKPVAAACEALGFREQQGVSVPYSTFMFEGQNVFYDLTTFPQYEKLAIYERKITSSLFV